MSVFNNASNIYYNGTPISQAYLNNVAIFGILTPTPSVTPSVSITPSRTPSITPSISRTPSITPSITRTPSVTPSITRTPSITPTITRSITPTPSITPSITPTRTVTPSITPSTSALGTRLYSNFDDYIIDGVRQATTGDLIRTNISSARRLIVTETISIRGFVLVRIPPDNWSTTSGYGFQPTLSVVSGTGATIDGGSSSKSFSSQVTILNPSTAAERTGGTSQYDIYRLTPSNGSTTTLTSGEYTLSVLGTAANMTIATLTTSTFPIDTSGTIYPSGSATHFAMEVF